MSKINDGAPSVATKQHIDRALKYYKEHQGDKTPPKAKDIIEYAANQEGLDARSAFGKDLLEKLVEFDIFPARAHKYIHKKAINLEPEQEEYIRGNASRMKWFDCARALFPNIDNLTTSSNEARAVKVFYDSLPASLKLEDTSNDASDSTYYPPKSLEKIISRINKYVLHGINKDKITNAQKNDCNALLGYMNNYRFTQQMNRYEKQDERDTFEDAFVRYTYDKADLTQEEIDQYLLLAGEVVAGFRNNKIISLLQRSLEREAENRANQDEDNRNDLSIKLAEQIKQAQEEHNKCVARQVKLFESLQGKRSERIKNRLSSSGSFLNVIDAWKQEETRKKMIKFAQKRREALAVQLDEYQTMDDMKVEIFGITREELLDE